MREGLALTLFISGASPASVRALETVRTLLEQGDAEPYLLDVVDVQRRPELAADDVIGVPSLVRHRPGPVRVLVGDFGNQDHVLAVLGLPSPRAAGAQA